MNTILLYTQPSIIGLHSSRPHISFKHILNNKRYRIFSGVEFGMGTTRGLSERELSLYYRSLLNVVTTKLNERWNPEDITALTELKTQKNELLKEYDKPLRAYIEKADYGTKHKYTLKWYWGELLKQFPKTAINNIHESDITTHLMNRYASSNTSINTAKPRG